MTLETVARDAMCNALVDLTDLGTVVFETSGDAEVATCTFGATAFGAASSGVATAETITPDASATGGVVDHAKIRKGDTTLLWTATCGTSGTDFIFASVTVPAAVEVDITSMTVTVPAS